MINQISFTGVKSTLEEKYEKITYPNGVQYRNWIDGEDYFVKYTIKQPHGIVEDLKQCLKDLHWERRIEPALTLVENGKKFLNEKIFGIIGTGALTTVFDIGDGRVLKISQENPFEYRKYNPKFDVPLLSNVEEHEGIFGYIQAKANTEDVRTPNVLSVQRKMKRAGFAPSRDFATHRLDQIGIYKGESVLLDSRCAVPQNNRLTRFAKWFEKYFTLKRVIILQPISESMNFEPPKHIDEAPLPNYTKKEAWAVIKKVIKSWK